MSEKIFQQVPAPVLPRFTDEEMRIRSRSFLKSLSNRRTIRDFSDKFIERDIIENCIKVAGSAPRGANMQPRHFVLISDQAIKKQNRIAAEKERVYRHTGSANEEGACRNKRA